MGDEPRTGWLLWLIPLVVIGVAGATFLVYLITTEAILRVRSTPSGVTVTVNGDVVGVTPDSVLSVNVAPGTIHLVLAKDGYKTVTSSFTIRRGEVFELDQSMRRPGMVFVRGGRFEMGTSDGAYNERPVHAVFLDAFYIDRTEVTVAVFRSYNPEYEPAFEGDELPATDISWAEANDFCQSSGKRLPTEAQWERACRGPGGNDYAYGDDFDTALGRSGGKLSDGPVSVSTYPAGNAGAVDMTGNVWEWCADWYDRDTYRVSPPHKSGGPDSGDRHVLRGGAWFSNASFSKCTHRPGNIRAQRDPSFGFRCVQDLN